MSRLFSPFAFHPSSLAISRVRSHAPAICKSGFRLVVFFAALAMASNGLAQRPAPIPEPPPTSVPDLTKAERERVEREAGYGKEPPPGADTHIGPDRTDVTIRTKDENGVEQTTTVGHTKNPTGGVTDIIIRPDGTRIYVYPDSIEFWTEKGGTRVYDRKTGKFVRALPPVDPNEPTDDIQDEAELTPTPRPPGNIIIASRAPDQVGIDIAGTGQTIGVVAMLTVKNLTPNKLTVSIPPMILESISGKNQDYACPESQTVALGPKQSKKLPLNGVCLVRNKPPVGEGIRGDLVINDGGAESTAGSSVKIPAKNTQHILKIATATYAAVKQLEKEGALKEIPYSDPKKKQDVVVQWSTWINPELSQITGVPPATKEDLQKVVYKQVPGTLTPEKKQKLDEGIDTIFETVELTTVKAKDLENPQAEEPAAPKTEGG